MDSTSSSMNSSFESISKSPDRQERENRRRQGEIFVFMAKIIGIFMKHYFKNCLMTSMITAITKSVRQKLSKVGFEIAGFSHLSL